MKYYYPDYTASQLIAQLTDYEELFTNYNSAIDIDDKVNYASVTTVKHILIHDRDDDASINSVMDGRLDLRVFEAEYNIFKSIFDFKVSEKEKTASPIRF